MTIHHETLGRGVPDEKVKKKDFVKIDVKTCEGEVKFEQVQSLSKEERLSEKIG